MKIEVGKTEYEAVFNGFTPIAYSRCFYVVGEERVDENGDKHPGTKRPKDIAEAVGLILASLQTVGIPAISALLEIFYACIKTATPQFDVPFNEWAASFPAEAYDMQKAEGWATDVMKIVQDNFFQSANDGVDTAPAEAPGAAASEKPS